MKDRLDAAIESRAVLSRVYGSASQVGDVRAHMEKLLDGATVRWIPDFAFEAAGASWGISVFRGTEEPRVRIRRMVECRSSSADFVPAFFVPGDENPQIIIPMCVEQAIPIIARVGLRYDFLDLTVALPPSAIRPEDRPRRLPSRLLTRIHGLRSIKRSFREPLAVFGQRYLDMTASGSLSPEDEAREVQGAARAVLEANPEMAETLEPLEILSWIETRTGLMGYRDHYFHSFHNLLLGFVVLDEAYDEFRAYARNVMHLPNASLECIWFLAALNHDVGYPAQWGPEFESMRFGIPADQYREDDDLRAKTEEQLTAMWGREECQHACEHLASLWEFLTGEHREYPWIPDPTYSDSRFADALRLGFIKGHGVAGAVRLLLELAKIANKESDQERRQFWWHHFYQAAMAIPFHDYAFREALRRKGISGISTKRFPFASLLAFIDSIQEDRRENPRELGRNPDILHDIRVVQARVIPIIDFNALSRERLLAKRMEARELDEFLDCDGLEFIYPEQLLGTKGPPVQSA